MDPSRFLAQIPSETFEFSEEGYTFEPPEIYGNVYASPKSSRKNIPPTVSSFINKNTGDRSYQSKVKLSRSQRSLPKESSIAKPVVDDFSQVEVGFRIGQYVSHNKYGQGKITSLSGFGSDMSINVLFNNGLRKKMIAQFANLEIL